MRRNDDEEMQPCARCFHPVPRQTPEERERSMRLCTDCFAEAWEEAQRNGDWDEEES